MKYYFSDLDDSGCYTMAYWLDRAEKEGLKEMELYEAIPDPDKDHAWCNEFDALIEPVECGKQCERYNPINGKSGKCRYKVGCYEHGEKVTVKIRS